MIYRNINTCKYADADADAGKKEKTITAHCS